MEGGGEWRMEDGGREEGSREEEGEGRRVVDRGGSGRRGREEEGGRGMRKRREEGGRWRVEGGGRRVEDGFYA